MVSVIVVVCVSLPLLPVMVIVSVPAAVPDFTWISRAADPAPVMVVGLKATVTPLFSPEADKVITPLKPPETVLVTFEMPWLPGATVTLLGFALIVKLPAVPVTVRVSVVVFLVLPEVPATLMV
jgi:hypothetical protein